MAAKNDKNDKNLITRDQYINRSGIDFYTSAFVKKKYKQDVRKSVEDWTQQLLEDEAIQDVPDRLKSKEEK